MLISTYTKALQDQVCLTLLDISEWMAPSSLDRAERPGQLPFGETPWPKSWRWWIPSIPANCGTTRSFPTRRPSPCPIVHHGLALAVILGWVAETPTGEWDDLRDGWLRRTQPGYVTGSVSRLSMTESPGRARGDLDKRCFFLRALKRLSEAQIVVANHSLMLIRDQMTAEIPRLVVDEAHELESAARSAFTGTVSERGLWRLLYSVYGGNSSGNLLYRYLRSLPGGAARDRGQVSAEHVSRYWRSCQPRIEEAREISGGLLGGNPGLVQQLGKLSRFLPGSPGSISTARVGKR